MCEVTQPEMFELQGGDTEEEKTEQVGLGGLVQAMSYAKQYY